MKYVLGYYTDEGLRRRGNQDALLIKTASSPYGRIGLFTVCDGMGGLSNGELASSTVVRKLGDWFDNGLTALDFNEIDENDVYRIINKKINEINADILNYGFENGQKLGTTLTMVLLVNNKYYVFHIGDSRAYIIDTALNNNSLNQLTVDQSYVQREIDRGNITVEQGLSHPKRNILLQCIGAKEEIEIDFNHGQVEEGQVFIVCSDGFYRKITTEEAIGLLCFNSITTSSDINNKLNILSEMAKARDERDNITAIVVKVLK